MVWKTSKLGDACEMIKRGVGPKYLDEGGICVVNQKCVRGHSVNYTLARRHDLDSKKVNEERYIKVGDVLVNSTGTGTLGRVAQIRAVPPEPTTVDTHVTIVRPKPNVFFDDFFGYMLIKIEEEITLAGEGASGQTELARTKLENEFFVSYPDSILEQKRIVTILDQAFASIDQARAKTEQNLKNARELFESYLQQVFSQRGEGWTESTLGEFAEFKNGLNFSKSSKGEKLKIVGVKNFNNNFFVPLQQLETIQIDGCLASGYELKENDIITVRSNGNKRLIGRCLLMGKTDRKTSYSGFTIRIRLTSQDIDPEFLTYYMKSASTHELLIGSGEGVNISNLNQKILTALPIHFPSTDTQLQLVENVKKIEFETSKLIQEYEKKLNTIDELKKSILQKAFTGELTKEKNKKAVT